MCERDGISARGSVKENHGLPIEGPNGQRERGVSLYPNGAFQ